MMVINRVLKKVCGTKEDKITGDWRRLQNEELHDALLTKYLYVQIKKNEMSGTSSHV